MEILHSIVVLIHLVGFATIFGSWLAEAVSKRREFTKTMSWGLVIALVAGLALAAPWGLGELNYVKLGVKLVVVVVIGAVLGIGSARQRRTGSAPAALFWLVGVLTVANAAIAVIWH